MKATLRRFSQLRFLLGLAAVPALGLAPGAVRAASTRSEVLDAIHRVENPHDTSRPGPCGELGAYQFKPATWRMHTTMPFALALNREAADTVAVRHYEWIKSELLRHNIRPSAYNIALAWNGGLWAEVKGRSPAAAQDYAERVNNLVQEMRATRLASLH